MSVLDKRGKIALGAEPAKVFVIAVNSHAQPVLGPPRRATVSIGETGSHLSCIKNGRFP